MVSLLLSECRLQILGSLPSYLLIRLVCEEPNHVTRTQTRGCTPEMEFRRTRLRFASSNCDAPSCVGGGEFTREPYTLFPVLDVAYRRPPRGRDIDGRSVWSAWS